MIYTFFYGKYNRLLAQLNNYFILIIVKRSRTVKKKFSIFFLSALHLALATLQRRKLGIDRRRLNVISVLLFVVLLNVITLMNVTVIIASEVKFNCMMEIKIKTNECMLTLTNFGQSFIYSKVHKRS